jgi:ribosomal protein S18 acetylase RimI-like enzyme
VYSDGWANDYSWLNLLYEVVGRVPSFRLDNLRSLLTEDEAARWHDTKAQMRAELRPERHRASVDARVLQLTLLRIKHGHQVFGKAAQAHEIRLIEEMVELDALTLSDFIADSLGRFDRNVRREQHAVAMAGGARVLAEHLNHRLAGYVLLRPAKAAEWEILSINIHPWYRSTGLHRRLLTRTLAHLLSHGARVVSSLVLSSQEQAARLHERLGFERKGEGGAVVRYSLAVADLAKRLRQG